MLNRRRWMQLTAAGGLSSSLRGSLPALAAEAKRQGRQCILLWMAGGPSQIDTFDMKPGHANGGSFQETSTNVPGIRFSEHLPQLARQAERLAILRGVSTKEGDHNRGTVLMQTGHSPGSGVRYPTIGCAVSKELADGENPNHSASLPNYVSIGSNLLTRNVLGPGFLGPRYAPTAVSASQPADSQAMPSLRVDYLHSPVDPQRRATRIALWNSMQQRYQRLRPTDNIFAHDTVYRASLRMIEGDAKEVFDLDQEPTKIREAYGRGIFGQGCLMARRLIERGVPVVEVTLGNGLQWDTHRDNFDTVEQLSSELDHGWATLMNELAERGLLETTTLLWAGEFGRTPTINSNGGRDHFPQAFTCVLAGGGIAGGQTFGRTSDDGMEVVDQKINQHDLLATLCQALKINPATENIASGGRPVMISDGTAVDEILR